SSFTFFFHATPTPQLYTLSLHDALPISSRPSNRAAVPVAAGVAAPRSSGSARSGTATPQTCPARGSPPADRTPVPTHPVPHPRRDRKSTRLNSSHDQISYAVFCLKKKTK